MTAEEGFQNAMAQQIDASLKGDRKRAERARTMVMHFRKLMDRKRN